MRSHSTTDPQRLVTEQDVLGAVVALGCLPKRDSDQAEVDLAAYRVALDGVTAGALAGAVRKILQGELMHAFFPSPPELRLTCNTVQRDHARAAERDWHVRRAREEASAFPPVEHSEASKARVAATYRKFCEQHAAAKLAGNGLGFASGQPSRSNDGGMR